MALVMSTSLAFSQQMSDTEIMNMISRSKEYNQQHAGVTNPDKILPGQKLTYLFKEGSDIVEASVIVDPGENQWTIVRDKLSKLVEEHGPVVDYDYVIVDSIYETVVDEAISVSKIKGGNTWLALVVFLGLIFLFVGFLYFMNRRRNVDPTTAGVPQVPGGVNDSKAYTRMTELSQERFPGARLEIKNIRRGFLSGLADVFYEGNKKRKIRLNKVHAYAGEILVNGVEETIYFLQGCGNDARKGDYFRGQDLVFEPKVTVNQDGSTIPICIPPIEVPQGTEVQILTGSEFHQHVNTALKIMETAMNDGNKHKVDLTITQNSVNVKIEDSWPNRPETGSKNQRKTKEK